MGMIIELMAEGAVRMKSDHVSLSLHWLVSSKWQEFKMFVSTGQLDRPSGSPATVRLGAVRSDTPEAPTAAWIDRKPGAGMEIPLKGIEIAHMQNSDSIS